MARPLYFVLVTTTLTVVLAGAIWGWSTPYVSSGDSPGRVMSAAEAHRKALAGEVVLVDVRRPSEWRQSGVPASGHAVTMHQDAGQFRAELLQAMDYKPDRPLALICATGGRTTWLLPRLRQMGFRDVINVAEGMMGGRHGQGWLLNGLPTRAWVSATASTAPRITSGR